MLLPRSLVFLLGGTLVFSSPIKRETAPPTAVVANGTVEGIVLPTFDQDAFLGVPFAQPPLGDLRLRHPRSLNTSYAGGVHEAKTYPPFCVGIGSANWAYENSEDCLYLNVIRPAGTSAGDDLPVGVWIYGGSWQSGGSADVRYNSSWIVQRSVEMGKPIMVVSINYRVAALGFMSSAELAESGGLNSGYYDQRLALNWIHENIKAFGGAPDKVTIWGESAGAFSVGIHLLGYGLNSTNLFRAGILESGSPFVFDFPQVASYQSSFQNLSVEAGCNGTDTLDCLRGLSLDDFNKTASAYTFFPVVDGNLVSKSATESFNRGEFVFVPILLGTNTDEGTSFGGSGINTTEQFVAAIPAIYPAFKASTAGVLQYYPEEPALGCPYMQGDTVLPGGLQQKRVNAFVGDALFHSGKRRLAAAYADSGAPVFSYHWNQAPENATNIEGVAHFVEVAYVFSVPNEIKTDNTLGNRTGDAELAHLVTSQWVSFIHDLTPNNHGIDNVPDWPDYRTNASNFVHTRHSLSIEADDYRKEAISYLQSVGY